MCNVVHKYVGDLAELPNGFLKDFIDFLKYLHGVPSISFKTITDFLKDTP